MSMQQISRRICNFAKIINSLDILLICGLIEKVFIRNIKYSALFLFLIFLILQILIIVIFSKRTFSRNDLRVIYQLSINVMNECLGLHHELNYNIINSFMLRNHKILCKCMVLWTAHLLFLGQDIIQIKTFNGVEK